MSQLESVTIPRKVFQYIEHELYNYEHTKNQIEELRTDIINGATIYSETIPNVGSITDSTARKGIRLITNTALAKMTRTVNDIDRAMRRLNEEHKMLFELKYKQGKKMQAVCNEMPTSERTYFRLRKEIVVMVAIEMGLVENPF